MPCFDCLRVVAERTSLVLTSLAVAVYSPLLRLWSPADERSHVKLEQHSCHLPRDGISPMPAEKACDLLCGLTREPDLGCSEKWFAVASKLTLITIKSYLVNSDSWQYTPSLKRYRELGRDALYLVGASFAERLGSALTDGGSPVIICVEKPFLDGFVDGIAKSLHVPFVLLAVSGGDAPLTHDVQDKIRQLPSLRACFANNLHEPRDKRHFHPMPIGLDGEALLLRIRRASMPWEDRDRRLLVAPMRNTNRLRGKYIEVLSSPEYSHLVKIVNARMGLEPFMQLVSSHRCVLSPPGRGYDCGRTWQALALGTVPLVVDDPTFDQRLHESCGAAYIPRPEALTVDIVARLLSSLESPTRYEDRLQISHWKKLWESCICG